MKILIASDIHGSAFYCEKLIAAFEKENADKLLLLGDILYNGPRNDLQKEYAHKLVIPMLNSMKDKIFAVRGNCDTEVDQMVLEFSIMAEYCLLFVNGRTVFVTHGHKFNSSCLPPMGKGDILLHGHTHITACEDHGSYVYLNPGSVSIPKEGTGHGYMTLEEGVFIWKDFDGRTTGQYEG